MSRETRKRIQELYADGAAEYDRYREADPRGALLSAHDVTLFGAILDGVPADRRVLEVGAGTGRFTLAMLRRGHAVTATDVNEGMLERLRQKVAQESLGERCQIGREDAFALSFVDGSFDLVVSLHVIPRFVTLDDQQRALHEMCRVLRPGGTLVFNFSNSRSPYGRLFRGHAASVTEMSAALGRGGAVVRKLYGKHLLVRSLLNRVPLWLGRGLATVDRGLRGFAPRLAWDVFVVAEKAPDQR